MIATMMIILMMIRKIKIIMKITMKMRIAVVTFTELMIIVTVIIVTFVTLAISISIRILIVTSKTVLFNKACRIRSVNMKIQTKKKTKNKNPGTFFV